MVDAAQLVSRHLLSLVGEARENDVALEDVTMELAAHAACAALAFWSALDLHALIDVADEDTIDLSAFESRPTDTVIPFRRRLV